MVNLIAVTSLAEQKKVIDHLREALTLEYHLDLSVKVVQSTLNQVELHHYVKESVHIGAIYRTIFVPITMNLDGLRGFSPKDNVNINRVLAKLDAMKKEVIDFTNNRKVPTAQSIKQKKALAAAAQKLFS